MKTVVFYDRGQDNIKMKEIVIVYEANLLLVVLIAFVILDEV